MRKIKFRAWDSNRKLMITEGGYIQIDGYGNFEVFNEANDSWDKNGEDGNDLVLMQFTGLKDKNGKEIYEGDIVTWNDKDWFVDWNKRNCQYFLRTIDSFNKKLAYGEWLWCKERMEKFCKVIGNIYENPELLKGELNG